MDLTEWLERNERILIAVPVAVAFAIRALGLGSLPPFIDESGYLTFLHTNDPHFSQMGKVFGQYLFRIPVAFGGESIFGLRLFIASLGALTTLGVYVSGRQFGGVVAGLCAALLWALQPMVVFHDRLALHDPMIGFFYAWSLVLMHRAMREGGVALALGSGLLSGFGSLIKIPMVFMAGTILAIGIASVGLREAWKRRVEICVFGATVAAMVVPFAGQLAPPKQFAGTGGRLIDNLRLAANWILEYNSALFAALMLGAVAVAVFRRDSQRVVLWLSFALPICVMANLLDVMFARYLLVLLIPMTIAVGWTAAEWIKPAGGVGNRAAWWAAFLIFAGLLADWTWRDAAFVRDPLSARIPDDDYRQYVAGWPSGNGLPQLVEFLRNEASRSTRPLLVSVGGFGRHGSWMVKRELKDLPNVEFRVGFADTPAVLSELANATQDRRVLVLDERPVYEIPERLLRAISPPVRPVWVYERSIPRLGITDGGLRLLELTPGSRTAVLPPTGGDVPAGSPAVIESLANPNGLEGTEAGRFFWIGGPPTELIVRSGQSGILTLEGEFRLGPSLSGRPLRRILVRASNGFESAYTLGAGPGKITVPIEFGRTRIEITAIDKRTIAVLPNGDARPLLVGVEGLHVAGVDEKKNREEEAGRRSEMRRRDR